MPVAYKCFSNLLEVKFNVVKLEPLKFSILSSSSIEHASNPDNAEDETYVLTTVGEPNANCFKLRPPERLISYGMYPPIPVIPVNMEAPRMYTVSLNPIPSSPGVKLMLSPVFAYCYAVVTV